MLQNKLYPRPRFTARRGFTLVEILVASLILGIGLLAVAQCLLFGLKSYKEAQRVARASIMAQQEIEKVLSEGLPSANVDEFVKTYDTVKYASTNGYGPEWMEFQFGYRRKITVSPYSDATYSISSSWNLARVEVDYSWETGKAVSGTPVMRHVRILAVVPYKLSQLQ